MTDVSTNCKSLRHSKGREVNMGASPFVELCRELVQAFHGPSEPEIHVPWLRWSPWAASKQGCMTKVAWTRVPSTTKPVRGVRKHL